MPVAIAEGVILLFFLIFFISIGLACLFTKKGKIRKIAITCVVALFFGPFLWFVIYAAWEYFLAQIKTLPARKVFYTRCSTAGEKVYKTADNVEGVLLMNIRGLNGRNNDLYWPDAALPFEGEGDSYIRSFLTTVYGNYVRNKGYIYKYNNYRYVDVKEVNGIMRYRIDTEDNGKLKIEPSPPELARYTVSFVNHDNAKDREIGIASTTITIEDTLTGEKMAERISYAFSPPRFWETRFVNWNNAITCPKGTGKNRESYYVTRSFVNQVIKPKQEY